MELDLGDGNSDMPTNKRLKAVKRCFDDALVALLFQYGRYLTISASRKGTAAMNLQGIWNEHMRAPWSSNYTININTEMNYWCTDICNLSECFEPLTELVKSLRKKVRLRQGIIMAAVVSVHIITRTYGEYKSCRSSEGRRK